MHYKRNMRDKKDDISQGVLPAPNRGKEEYQKWRSIRYINSDETSN